MNEQQLSQIRWYFTGFVTITIWALLVGQYFNGGVPSHHLLQRADMPEISNWWGGVLLPVLAWFALGRIHQRIINNNEPNYPRAIIVGFIGALIYGGIFSASFAYGNSEITSILLPGILVLSLFFKLYKEECALGVILSMSFVFGAVLPTVFALVVGVVSALIYHIVHFIYSRASLWLMKPKNN
ncbi:hypothetical protein RI844_11220 [Thalassotalea fonticola]|uniref:Tryptophan-rich sensory protein n=1 Tax=Thalassotalea fonticola TaxID=3065649 RepID=A0ABZ0GJA8_9GAMM|nr:hypothetical protein RI844_11220 [Colwelliaceae bacterium S1-1]